MNIHNQLSPSNFKFFDIHYHASPDLYDRKYDVFSTGKIYKNLDGAVVLKSHLGATTIQATLAQQVGLPVFPSLVLNHINGGISFKNILKALAEYQPNIPSKLIVHFPTITGRNYQSLLTRQISKTYLSKETLKSETLFDNSDSLRPEVIDILKLSRDYPIILSTGHASKLEIYHLINACIQFNVPSLLLNQPANPLSGFKATELIELDSHPFIWIEQTALTYVLGYQCKDDFRNVLRCVRNLIYSSDFGQTNQMNIQEWLAYSKQWFAEFNLSLKRQKEICLKNPSNLLLM